MHNQRKKTETVTLSLQELGVAVRLFVQSMEDSLAEKEKRYRLIYRKGQLPDKVCLERIRYYSQVRGHLRECLANELNWNNHLPRLNLILDAIEEGRKASV